MRYALVSLMLGVILICVLIGTADDAELAAFDPFHPTSLLPIVAHRMQKVPFLVREFVDEFTAPYRQRVERATTLPPEPR